MVGTAGATASQLNIGQRATGMLTIQSGGTLTGPTNVMGRNAVDGVNLGTLVKTGILNRDSGWNCERFGKAQMFFCENVGLRVTEA